MALFDAKTVAAIQRANLSHGLYEAALKEFATYCEVHQWHRAEEARLKVVTHLEAFLDATAEMHRILRSD